MNHASTTRAVCAASRGSRLARLVQTGVAAVVLAVLSCGPAQAQRQGGADNGDPRMQQQDPRMQQPQREQRFDPRSFDSRNFDPREFDDRRQQDQGMRQDARRSGRLTPDERRDLRRQINEAGMDLYSHPPRRGH